MRTARAITLMYHDVVPPEDPDGSGFPGRDAARYKLTVGEFQAHLEAIRAAIGARPVGLVDSLDGDAIPLLFTFDDGGASSYHPIADLLEERGWRGHFFVATDYMGQRGFLTPQQMRDLRGRGHLVGSHSCSHPRVMRACGATELRRQWRDSAAALGEILGEPVKVASVPGGHYSVAVAEAAAAAGIRVLFHSVPVVRCREEGGCLVLGRFAVKSGTSPRECAALASGRRWPALRRRAVWGAKRAAQAVSLRGYLRARDRLVGW